MKLEGTRSMMEARSVKSGFVAVAVAVAVVAVVAVAAVAVAIVMNVRCGTVALGYDN